MSHPHLEFSASASASESSNEPDDHSSNSSSSSASSTASTSTVRPPSRDHPPSWKSHFTQELHLTHSTPTHHANYHLYLTPPSNPTTDPLFICHHGAGSSALSFALLATHIRRQLPHAGIVSLSARGHGSTITPITATCAPDYSLSTLTTDIRTTLTLLLPTQNWPHLPPTILIGHSLGAAILTNLLHISPTLFPHHIGSCTLDVVEGSALPALSHMKSHLSARPQNFPTLSEAIDWHIRTRALRDRDSAEVSVPSLLVPCPGGGFTWRTDLTATSPWWEEWFTGMSRKFLTGRGAKLLILAGTDRLDRELMIGQMQGKFQLVVIPEAGHFVQEDAAEKTAGVLVEFFKRNDRSQMVLPPKVSELLAQGKKV